MLTRSDFRASEPRRSAASISGKCEFLWVSFSEVRISVLIGFSLVGSSADKDRQLGEAHADIKDLRLSVRQREKAVEELTDELTKFEEKLKLTELLLQES